MLHPPAPARARDETEAGARRRRRPAAARPGRREAAARHAPGPVRLRARAARRAEALPGEYEALVRRALARLDGGNAALVAEVAALPELVRGYEQVKLRNVERFRARAAELLERLEAPVDAGRDQRRRRRRAGCASMRSRAAASPADGLARRGFQLRARRREAPRRAGGRRGRAGGRRGRRGGQLRGRRGLDPAPEHDDRHARAPRTARRPPRPLCPAGSTRRPTPPPSARGRRLRAARRTPFRSSTASAPATGARPDGLQRARRAPPAAPAPGWPGRCPSAAAQRAWAPSSASTCAGVAPFCGPNRRAAPSGPVSGAATSTSSSISTPRRRRVLGSR